MSEPITGTGLAGGALTGASVYGLLTGTDYGVVFGALVIPPFLTGQISRIR